jgi:hypothetical protein
MAGVQIGIGHFGAIGLEAVEVFDLRAVDRAALEKVASAEDGLGLAQAHDFAHDSELRTLFVEEIPVEPGEW